MDAMVRAVSKHDDLLRHVRLRQPRKGRTPSHSLNAWQAMADASPQSEADAMSTPHGKTLQRTLAYLTEMREGMVERQRAKTRADGRVLLPACVLHSSLVRFAHLAACRRPYLKAEA